MGSSLQLLCSPIKPQRKDGKARGKNEASPFKPQALARETKQSLSNSSDEDSLSLDDRMVTVRNLKLQKRKLELQIDEKDRELEYLRNLANRGSLSNERSKTHIINGSSHASVTYDSFDAMGQSEQERRHSGRKLSVSSCRSRISDSTRPLYSFRSRSKTKNWRGNQVSRRFSKSSPSLPNIKYIQRKKSLDNVDRRASVSSARKRSGALANVKAIKIKNLDKDRFADRLPSSNSKRQRFSRSSEILKIRTRGKILEQPDLADGWKHIISRGQKLDAKKTRVQVQQKQDSTRGKESKVASKKRISKLQRTQEISQQKAKLSSRRKQKLSRGTYNNQTKETHGKPKSNDQSTRGDKSSDAPLNKSANKPKLSGWANFPTRPAGTKLSVISSEKELNNKANPMEKLNLISKQKSLEIDEPKQLATFVPSPDFSSSEKDLQSASFLSIKGSEQSSYSTLHSLPSVRTIDGGVISSKLATRKDVGKELVQVQVHFAPSSQRVKYPPLVIFAHREWKFLKLMRKALAEKQKRTVKGKNTIFDWVLEYDVNNGIQKMKKELKILVGPRFLEFRGSNLKKTIASFCDDDKGNTFVINIWVLPRN